MPYQTNELLANHFKNNAIDLTHLEQQLNLVAPNSPNLPLYRDMMLTVLRMAHDDSDRWSAKITLQALRELDHAFRVLHQYKGRRKVTVFGSARTPVEHPMYALARELGATLARSDLMVITGAGGGIMAAAHEGAGVDNCLGFNITLPFEQHANATVDGTDKLLPFHFFFIRKLFFVKEADALVLCPGGFGTLDEALEVLTLIQTGKSPLVPVVLLDSPGGDLLAGCTGLHYPPARRQSLHPAERSEAGAPGEQRRRCGSGNQPVLQQLPLQPLAEEPVRDSHTPPAQRSGPARHPAVLRRPAPEWRLPSARLCRRGA